MSELFDRLRRQRGDREPEPDERDAAPRWLKESLRRREGGAPSLPDAERRTVGDPADLLSASSPRGEFAFRERRLDEAERHGEWELSEVDAADPETLGLLARDADCAELDLRRAVYLDVETTGLSGGAGTMSFLVALGTFDGGAFRLWQGFLRSPADEAALLEDVARRVRAADAVVSFFGKSFDRHRLEDKMRLFDIDPPFAERPHLDLYWPLVRLYGGAFGDGRLGTMESRLTGVRREDDLSGRYAPEAWFDYLAGRAHRLEDVFRHNADDVLSLAVLAAYAGRTRIGARRDGRPLEGPERLRAAGLARLCAVERRDEEALEWCRRALREEEGPAPSLVLLGAELLARTGRRAEALCEFLDLAGGEPEDSADAEVRAAAALAAAKLCEHAERDFARALAACERARALASSRLTGRARTRVLGGLDAREERLRRKAARPPRG